MFFLNISNVFVPDRAYLLAFRTKPIRELRHFSYHGIDRGADTVKRWFRSEAADFYDTKIDPMWPTLMHCVRVYDSGTVSVHVKRNILLPSVEFRQNIIPKLITEWKYAKYIVFKAQNNIENAHVLGDLMETMQTFGQEDRRFKNYTLNQFKRAVYYERELNRLHQLLVYADDVNMLGENPQMIRENTGILLEESKEIATKYLFIVLTYCEFTFTYTLEPQSSTVMSKQAHFSDLDVVRWHQALLGKKDGALRLASIPTIKSFNSSLVTAVQSVHILFATMSAAVQKCITLAKYFISQHISTTKHKNALSKATGKKIPLLPIVIATSSRKSQFEFDLCKAFLAAEIPLWKVYLSRIVRSSPIGSLVPFSTLECKRRFSMRKRIFAECDIRLIVLNSLNFLAL
ncbi:hypothetical protein ANN_18050 [Periplaneta americana]|uniref:Uncharacterized protein n=1 Tax=Periplaneta americana TaxID=6978 RepID=A0ABQ8SPR8_PERAM|nr:hypothetical protein ANN_18050 [Periplaneta americana]